MVQIHVQLQFSSTPVSQCLSVWHITIFQIIAEQEHALPKIWYHWQLTLLNSEEPFPQNHLVYQAYNYPPPYLFL